MKSIFMSLVFIGASLSLAAFADDPNATTGKRPGGSEAGTTAQGATTSVQGDPCPCNTTQGQWTDTRGPRVSTDSSTAPTSTNGSTPGHQ